LRILCNTDPHYELWTESWSGRRETHRGIVASLSYIYQKCFPKSCVPEPYSDSLPRTITHPLGDLSEAVYRRCSNTTCDNRECVDEIYTVNCRRCFVPSYCSHSCRKADHRHGNICDFLRSCGNGKRQKPFTRRDARYSRKRKFGDSIKNRQILPI